MTSSNVEIRIKVEAASKEEAVQFFDKIVDEAREKGWKVPTFWGGGGGYGNGPKYSISIVELPLTDQERIERIEKRLDIK